MSSLLIKSAKKSQRTVFLIFPYHYSSYYDFFKNEFLNSLFTINDLFHRNFTVR